MFQNIKKIHLTSIITYTYRIDKQYNNVLGIEFLIFIGNKRVMKPSPKTSE